METIQFDRRYEAHVSFPGNMTWENVEMDIFREGPKVEISEEIFSRLIEGYDSHPENRGYAEAAIREMFTAEEVKQVREYFERAHAECLFESSEVDFPIPYNAWSAGAYLIGSPCDHYLFYDEDDYDLSFNIFGCYDEGAPDG